MAALALLDNCVDEQNPQAFVHERGSSNESHGVAMLLGL
jgi:hypothetical protein